MFAAVIDFMFLCFGVVKIYEFVAGFPFSYLVNVNLCVFWDIVRLVEIMPRLGNL